MHQGGGLVENQVLQYGTSFRHPFVTNSVLQVVKNDVWACACKFHPRVASHVTLPHGEINITSQSYLHRSALLWLQTLEYGQSYFSHQRRVRAVGRAVPACPVEFLSLAS